MAPPPNAKRSLSSFRTGPGHIDRCLKSLAHYVNEPWRFVSIYVSNPQERDGSEILNMIIASCLERLCSRVIHLKSGSISADEVLKSF